VGRNSTSKWIVFSFPVVFDPASFYGHHEFELAIAGMFGGFNSTYYQAYHNLIPKAPGFEARHKLYQLYHYLNHWLVSPFAW
jgi:fructosamine-3-kinase